MYNIYTHIWFKVKPNDEPRQNVTQNWERVKNIEQIWYKEVEITTRSQRTKEKDKETVQKYYEANKDKIYQYIKEKREGNKIKSFVSKLESIHMEVLAKILIDARKTKLLEIQE